MNHTMPVSRIGIIGLGPMGAALAQNFASRSVVTAVYNRTYKKTAAFIKKHGDTYIIPTKSLKALVASLTRPRSIMIMVKAGPAVDAVIDSLLPYLQKGDLIIDGGNSYYRDTQRRFQNLRKRKIHFIGCGVSGGEEGARTGPSLMPGGSHDSWKIAKPLLSPIAAKDFSGKPCVTYIGDNAAGHYVKMVHNGIEYGIMQLMAETYALLRKVYKMSAPDIAMVFKKMNKGKLNSFLFEIAVPVLSQKDEKKGECCLIYNILDTASNKGTGKWASIDALDRGIAIPTITQAVYARYISTEKNIRVKLNKQYPHKHPKKIQSQTAFIRLLEDALYVAIISTFAQGFDMIERAAQEEHWNINMAEIARIWEGGCIIRSKLLNVFHIHMKKHTGKHVFLIPAVASLMNKHQKKLRTLVADATTTGIPLPAFGSSLFYFESMTEKRLPANMIQGLRDYFGSHTYERIDDTGSFHTIWS